MDARARRLGAAGLSQLRAARQTLPSRRHRGWLLADWSASKGALALASANAGEAAALDAGKPYDGLPSLKCTFSTTASGLFLADYTLNTPVHLNAFDTIQMPIWVSSYVSADGAAITARPLQLWVYTADGGQVRFQVKRDGYRPGAWDVVSLNRSMGGDITFGAPNTVIGDLANKMVTKVRLVQTAGTGSDAYPVWVGPLRVSSKATPRCVIVMDGQYDSQYDYVRPMLDKYGLKSSLALQYTLLGTSTRMSAAEVAEMYDNGHEVIHHSHTQVSAGWGDGTAYPDAAAVTADIQASWAAFEAQGWTRGIGHAVHGITYAWDAANSHATHDKVLAGLAGAGVLSARRSVPRSNLLQQHADPAGVNWWSLSGGIQLTSTDTGANVVTLIDRAIALGETLIVTVHKAVLDSATPGSLEMKNGEFATWIDYLAGKRDAGLIRVTPQGQFYREVSSGAFQ